MAGPCGRPTVATEGRPGATGGSSLPELDPNENIWDEIREKIFKNYALKSIDAVGQKLREAAGQSDPELDMSSDLWAALAT